MFVGEAPGRLGADRTAVPFHGDKSGDNFETLLGLAGLSRREVFVTNAVLCNPKDESGNNASPPRSVLRNCSDNLQRQIEAINPKIVVTLGSAALESTRLIEEHSLTLSESVRTANKWNGRVLIPLYHPGARAMIHRNFAAQTADYYFVGEQARRATGRTRVAISHAKRGSAAWEIVKYVLSCFEETSLFRLHKAMYILDLKSTLNRGFSLTDFFYIRQKDGPYCVELGSRWYKTYDGQIEFRMHNGRPWLSWHSNGLFDTAPSVDGDDRRFIDNILGNLRSLSDAQIKTKSYLTRPMKQSLKAERSGAMQLNRPLL
jgi:uracil-DNA glycosylase family 4